LISTYISKLPPSYLNSPGATTSDIPSSSTEPHQLEINHPILRSIQSLINRLSITVPADKTAFEQEMLAEKNDVALVSLLASLTKNVRDSSEMGRKFAIADAANKREKKGNLTNMDEILRNTGESHSFGSTFDSKGGSRFLA